MRNSTLRILTICCSAIGSPLMAQGGMPTTGAPPRTPPTDAQIAAIQSSSMRLLHPAELVLDFKKELNLRPDQIEQLQQLVLAQRDSAQVRLARRSNNATAVASNPATKAMTDWAAPIDEQAIRAGMCEQSKSTADYMLDMIHDQHAVGAVLTEAQRSQIPMLQSQMMLKGMKSP